MNTTISYVEEGTEVIVHRNDNAVSVSVKDQVATELHEQVEEGREERPKWTYKPGVNLMQFAHDSMMLSSCDCEGAMRDRRLGQILFQKLDPVMGKVWKRFKDAGLVGHFNGSEYLVHPLSDELEKSGRFKTKSGQWTSFDATVSVLARDVAAKKTINGAYPTNAEIRSAKNFIIKILADLYYGLKQEWDSKKESYVWRMLPEFRTADDVVVLDSTYSIPVDHLDAEYDHRKTEGTVACCPYCGNSPDGEHTWVAKSRSHIQHECALKGESHDGATDKHYHLYITKSAWSKYEGDLRKLFVAGEVHLNINAEDDGRWQRFNDVNKPSATGTRPYLEYVVHCDDVTGGEAFAWALSRIDVGDTTIGQLQQKVEAEDEEAVALWTDILSESWRYDCVSAHGVRMKQHAIDRQANIKDSWYERLNAQKYIDSLLGRKSRVKVEEMEAKVEEHDINVEDSAEAFDALFGEFADDDSLGYDFD